MQWIQRLVLVLISALTQAAVAEDTLWRLDGFAQPESAIIDSARERIIVSNIQGHPGEADGKGYLSLVSLEGERLQAAWINGLDAPKGMAILDEQLLVADLRRLHIIDLETGKRLRSISVDGAQFLNDISTSGDSAWITDLVTHTIYRFNDGKVTTWLQDTALAHPNGIAASDDHLLIASWGPGMRADFSTATPGGLLRVDTDTKAIEPIAGATTLGNLDGILTANGNVYVNDFITGTLFRFHPAAGTQRVGQFAPGLADIAYGNNILLLPFMHDGVVEARRLPE
jgi:sugar lactone lactonase YvrE